MKRGKMQTTQTSHGIVNKQIKPNHTLKRYLKKKQNKKTL